MCCEDSNQALNSSRTSLLPPRRRGRVPRPVGRRFQALNMSSPPPSPPAADSASPVQWGGASKATQWNSKSSAAVQPSVSASARIQQARRDQELAAWTLRSRFYRWVRRAISRCSSSSFTYSEWVWTYT